MTGKKNLKNDQADAMAISGAGTTNNNIIALDITMRYNILYLNLHQAEIVQKTVLITRKGSKPVTSR